MPKIKKNNDYEALDHYKISLVHVFLLFLIPVIILTLVIFLLVQNEQKFYPRIYFKVIIICFAILTAILPFLEQSHFYIIRPQKLIKRKKKNEEKRKKNAKKNKKLDQDDEKIDALIAKNFPIKYEDEK